MNRPKQIDKYIFVHKEEQRLKKEKATLRLMVITNLKEFGDYEDIKLSERQTVKIDEEELYKWIKESKPQHLEEVSRNTIDLEKFEVLVKSGKIEISEIPQTCYKVEIADMIILTKSKNYEG